MAADIKARRAQGQATVPSMLGDELRCNPFLRPSSPAIRQALGVPAAASDVEAFGAIRGAKVGWERPACEACVLWLRSVLMQSELM